MDFVEIFDRSAHGTKLIIECFERTGILNDKVSATLYELQVILEMKLVSFGVVTETIFKCEPYLVRSFKANDFDKVIFCKG